jgi:excisionase family DNA binding protein
MNESETKAAPRSPQHHYLTKAEVAHRLRCTTRTIDNWMTRGMPYYEFGGRRTLFIESEVDAFVKDRCHRVQTN